MQLQQTRRWYAAWQRDAVHRCVGLARNVRDAYAFIVNNYVPGDEIFLFGFSRGA